MLSTYIVDKTDKKNHFKNPHKNLIKIKIFTFFNFTNLKDNLLRFFKNTQGYYSTKLEVEFPHYFPTQYLNIRN